MIAAGELRSGNYLMRNSYYAKVTAQDIYLIESGIIKFLKPVPIDAEILQKCGFEFSNGLYKKGDCYLEYAGWHGQYEKNGYVGKALQYLHELQNLYFVITGGELEINTNDLPSLVHE